MTKIKSPTGKGIRCMFVKAAKEFQIPSFILKHNVLLINESFPSVREIPFHILLKQLFCMNVSVGLIPVFTIDPILLIIMAGVVANHVILIQNIDSVLLIAITRILRYNGV